MKSVININENVKVKLTDYGVSILRLEHEKLNQTVVSAGGKPLEPFKLITDEEGYYSEQLWTIMQTFGSHICMGWKQPFETEIIIDG